MAFQSVPTLDRGSTRSARDFYGSPTDVCKFCIIRRRKGPDRRKTPPSVVKHGLYTVYTFLILFTRGGEPHAKLLLLPITILREKKTSMEKKDEE